MCFYLSPVGSNVDQFKAEDVKLDLIDPEAFEEIGKGQWSVNQLRHLVLNMVLPKTAFKGKLVAL